MGVVPLGLTSVALNQIWTLRAHVSLLQALEANLVAFHKMNATTIIIISVLS